MVTLTQIDWDIEGKTVTGTWDWDIEGKTGTGTNGDGTEEYGLGRVASCSQHVMFSQNVCSPQLELGYSCYLNEARNVVSLTEYPSR